MSVFRIIGDIYIYILYTQTPSPSPAISVKQKHVVLAWTLFIEIQEIASPIKGILTHHCPSLTRWAPTIATNEVLTPQWPYILGL